MGPLRSVVLAGGGTGGHIYPLLAFADCLRRHDPGVRITCLGTPKGLENELIPPAGYDLRNIPAYQLPRSVNMNLVRTPGRMWTAARAAGKVIEEVRADVVVGFGGYVSVPAYLAAWRRELPIVIHEVNVPPGVANRLGMKFTKHVAVGFPHQPSQAESLRDARVVGVPLRRSITGLDRAAMQGAARAHFGLRPDLPVLFVAGGSQGARSINLAVAGAAKELARNGIQVLHVIGARNEPVPIPTDLPVPYVTLPVPVRHGRRVRRGGPDARPGRGDDLRRGGGHRPADHLRAVPAQQPGAEAQRAAGGRGRWRAAGRRQPS